MAMQNPNMAIETIPTNETFEGVRGYVDKDGTVMLKLEDCARGLGLTFVDKKNGVEYTVVRWNRVREYLKDEDFLPLLAESRHGADFKESFISEPEFYLLAMKVKSEAARAFRRKVATVILPSIRKHGAYMTPETIEKVLYSPDFIINLATRLKEEQAKVAVLTEKVEEMAPKSAYCDAILQCPDVVTVTSIAKDYGYSARMFNLLLHELGIQFRVGKLWVLYQEHAEGGYTQTKTFINDGHSTQLTYWTQRGRLFLYEELKKKGYLPTIERKG